MYLWQLSPSEYRLYLYNRHRTITVRLRPHDVVMERVLDVCTAVDWEQARSHRHSLVSPVTKTLMVLDRILTGASFSQLSRWYGISRVTCWRIVHDTRNNSFLRNNWVFSKPKHLTQQRHFELRLNFSTGWAISINNMFFFWILHHQKIN